MKSLLSLVAVIGLAAFAVGQEKDEKKNDNPFIKSKVGEWIEYKMTTTAGGMNIEGKMKMTVSEKTDKEATLKTVVTVNGMEVPGQETKIDLTKPYDPTNAAAAPKGAEIKTEKVEDGKEKLKVGDKEYDCTWTTMKITGKVNGVDLEADIKLWMTKELPLSGLLKMENTSKVMGSTFTMNMEYVSSGSK